MEGLAFWDNFSLPIHAFVQAFYNSTTIFTIVEWLRAEISKVETEYGGGSRRLYIGRAVAILNVAFWCYNLFAFLLPILL